MSRDELSELLVFLCVSFLFAFVVSLAVDIQELRRKKMEEGDGLVCPDCPPEEGTE